MSDALDPRLMEAAAYLAELPASERTDEAHRLRDTMVALMPDDEVGKPVFSTVGEYLDREIELPPMLVEPGLLARGSITAMIARGGKGKTSISLNKLVRWSMGKPLFDELPDVFCPVKPLRSLVIENEGAPGHFQEVLDKIVNRNGYAGEDLEAIRNNMHVYGDGGWSGLKLDDPEDLAMVDRATRESKADVLFVEPFRGLWRGEENSSTEMANVLDDLVKIANVNDCAVIVTHHERKSAPGEGGDAMDSARGSSVMEGVCAVMEKWKHVKNGEQSELSWIKSRYKDAPAPVRMEFVRDSWSYEYVTEDQALRSVLDLLSQDRDHWFDLSTVCEELAETQHTTRRLLEKGVKTGRLTKRHGDGKSLYRYKSEDTGDAEPLAIS